MKIRGQLAENIGKIGTKSKSQEELQRQKNDQSELTQAKKLSEDTVSISLAKQIQTELLETSSERLEELKRQIQAGKYSVSSTVLAEKITEAVGDEIFFSQLSDK